MLASDSWVVLVDVRPEEERAADGQPDLTTLGKEVIFVEWEAFDGTRNPDFIVELEDAGVDQFSTAIFICRSGRRATEAANAAADTMYSHTYNLEGGFSEGWKTAFLPWAVPAIEEGGP
jgi:rhodanese-related sulfurtransferase